MGAVRLKRLLGVVAWVATGAVFATSTDRTIEDLNFHRNTILRVDRALQELGPSQAPGSGVLVNIDGSTDGLVCSPTGGTELDPRLEFTRPLGATETLSYCSASAAGAEAFCSAALGACVRYRALGAQGCVLVPIDANTPNPIAQARTRSRTYLLPRMETHANQFLRSLAGTGSGTAPDFARQCCGTGGGSAECLSSLGATSMSFIREDESNVNWAGRYALNDARYVQGQGVRNRIVISEATLAHFITEQSVEELVIHELSHACQFSRTHLDFTAGMTEPQRNDEFDRFKFNDDRTAERTRADLVALTGSATVADCIDQAVRSQVAAARAAGGDARFAQQAKEAFADAVSAIHRATQNGDISQFSLDCARSADARHPSGVDTHLKCLLAHPGPPAQSLLRQRLCGPR
ncbi:MAG: hypothetical protein IT285_03760 [Bdellovibrionales bacterium]|nr:hypothetical protein [Bdellovibrionales bacterium]